MSEPYHKRIARPLLVQTKRDDNVLAQTQRALEEALAAVQKERARLDEEQEVTVYRENQSSREWENSVTREAWFTARKNIEAVFLKYDIATHENVLDSTKRSVEWEVLRDTVASIGLRTVWNEAIELAAQITGGTKGTLIRDLKEDRAY